MADGWSRSPVGEANRRRTVLAAAHVVPGYSVSVHDEPLALTGRIMCVRGYPEAGCMCYGVMRQEKDNRQSGRGPGRCGGINSAREIVRFPLELHMERGQGMP